MNHDDIIDALSTLTDAVLSLIHVCESIDTEYDLSGDRNRVWMTQGEVNEELNERGENNV
jgi:hypothetical protein